MKRIAISIVLILTVILSLVGCGSKSEVEIGEYDQIEIKKSEIEVTDEFVQSSIDELLGSYSTTETVTEGTVAEGDSVNISYIGYVDGVAFEGGTAENTPITLGSSGYIDGFDSGLIGGTIGSTIDLNLTFPDPYENNTALSGKAVVFTTTINSKNVTILPELTDAWVAENFSTEELSTVDGLYIYARETIEDSALKTAIWNAILEQTTVKNFDIKKFDSMVKSQKESYIEYISSTYGVELEVYYAQSGTTEEDIDSEIDVFVKDTLKDEMTVNAIAKEEGVSVTDEEFEEHLELLAEQYYYESVDALKEDVPEENIEFIRVSLLRTKIVDVLVEKIKVVD